MKTTKIIIQCDCCGKELFTNPVVKNDGSFQTEFVKIKSHDSEEIDLCFNCAGKIYELDRKKDTDIMTLKKHIDYLKFGINSRLDNVRFYHEGNSQC